ncbi:MAG: H+transporting two-sector ATPase C subunit [Gammaproteobacteria bacterium]|nr:H+transporting two-sector ATPase C subunit [Gammaproteobacteria bacterium]NIR85640.1 H+transporting two-sector ATPase C subunit [Gammaproteobacteria bacterium]NIR90128.1 H+transporting two-sector ATPase C subunit [Gammaproteobacteria bacterium]NIU06774.1 H+transporting two-sector ATPase C subunit [Gammaproteobacteria bacterium]NIV53707.1 H+transporting two-sector ATPase C subunit [Gammaproteobacteria bacterium]
MRKGVGFLIGSLAATVALGIAALAALLSPHTAPAAEAVAQSMVPAGVLQWGYLSAAVAAGLSALAAGYAVGMVGSAAVGALAEKPELLGRVLILVGLAEGIAIYGLIIAILILNRLV